MKWDRTGEVDSVTDIGLAVVWGTVGLIGIPWRDIVRMGGGMRSSERVTSTGWFRTTVMRRGKSELLWAESNM